MPEEKEVLGSVRFGCFELSADTGELRKDGQRLKLSGQAIQVLTILAANPGKLVTREDLQQKLWPGASYGDPEHGLNAAVNKLRETLGDSATEPKYIETVPGRGYRFIAVLDSPVAPPEPEPPEPQPGPPKPPWWKRNTTIAFAACLIVGLLYPSTARQIEWLLRQKELRRLTAVPLTSLPGTVGSPTFSPDGSQIAFAWDGGSPGLGFGLDFDLYVKVIGSEKLLRLTNKPGVYFAAWSPNGQSIAIERIVANQADSGVYLISPLGGPERKITNECVYHLVALGAIAWSPDGKQLVCVTTTSQTTSALLLLGVDSQQVVALKTDCKRPISPAFSPDGVYLVWICSEILGGSASIQLQRLGDARSTQLLKRADGIGKAVWSENGRRMVFTAPFPAGDILEVSLGNPDGPEKLPVGHDAFDVTVSSKGRRLAFAQNRTNVNIWRLELGAIEKHARMVIASTREQRAPDISPNGDQVAFESNRSGSNEVWVSDADGSNALQLSSFGIRLTGSPRWSPDGRLIAFDSRAGGESNIYLVDAHGGNPRKLEIDLRGNSHPSWSHDGKWIYFVNGEDVQHPTGWKVSSTGGHAVPIADGPVMQPIESPDGLLVYFVRDFSLYSVTIDGMTAEKVEGMPFVGVGVWTPVESGFYFIGYHTGGPAIEFFDVKTRDFRVVYVLEKPLGWVGAISVSSDGKWLLFPQLDEQSSDLMMVENWH